MKNNKKLILKTLVGSRAHNLHNENSDSDWRGVYVIPTTEILSLGFNYKGSHWLEGEKEDQTAYEIGHFLHLATKCNPTILEVFKAPEVALDERFYFVEPENKFTRIDTELRELFQYVWNPQDAFNAFVGYGLNQRKKMLDNHLDRWTKYATAYIRTLYNLQDLLKTGNFSLVVPEGPYRDFVIEVKEGRKSIGEIIDYTEKQTAEAKKLLSNCDHKPDLQKVHDFLMKVRNEFWDFES